MARIAALGEWRRIQALAIAGVEPHVAATDEEAIAEWSALPPDVAVLVVTKAAAAALKGRIEERHNLLVTVLP
jgi:vacuolar-type H+-ATPase subunit F/Vma7